MLIEQAIRIANFTNSRIPIMALKPKSLRDISLVKYAFPEPSQLKVLTDFVLTRDEVPHVELEDSLRAISRRFDRFPMKGRALDLYTNNRIRLLNNKETIKIPTLLPGWRMGGTHGVEVYVNATPYAPTAGLGAMDVRKLFGLMVFGAVLVDTYDKWDKISSSMVIAKSGAAVYARVMHKVVDRITGVGMDRMRSDQVKFIFAKYFLVNMLHRTANETTDSLATSATMGTANNALVDFEAAAASIAGVGTQTELYSLDFLPFVDAVAKSQPWLIRMTGRGFIQNYTSMYAPPALMGAEDAGYFFAILATHQAGADIVASFSFDPVYGREGDDVLDELARLVR